MMVAENYFWIGGATQWGDHPAKGLRALWMSGDNVSLTPEVAVGENPMFAASRAGLPLVVAHEVDSGSLTAYASPEGLLQDSVPESSQASTDGAGPTNVAFAELPDGSVVALSANYTSGSLSVNPIVEAKVQEPTLVVQYEGQGPDPQRQSSPHPHQVVVSPELGLALVPDLGTDSIHVHELSDLASGSSDHRDVALPPGSGPRHLVLSGSVALVACELSGIVRAVNVENGAQITDARASHWASHDQPNFPSAILLTSNNHVLVGNRGPDTIGVLKWDPLVEQLDYVTEVPSGGEHPRDLQLTEQEDALVVANLVGNNVTVFDYDDSAGLLQLRETLATNQPACTVRYQR